MINYNLDQEIKSKMHIAEELVKSKNIDLPLAYVSEKRVKESNSISLGFAIFLFGLGALFAYFGLTLEGYGAIAFIFCLFCFGSGIYLFMEHKSKQIPNKKLDESQFDDGTKAAIYLCQINNIMNMPDNSYNPEEIPMIKKAIKEYEKKFYSLQEKTEIARNVSLSKCTGYEKSQKIIQEKINIQNAYENRVANAAKGYYDSKMEAKVNPYAMGGAAEGIGGIGAGLAAFSEAVSNNIKADINNARVEKEHTAFANETADRFARMNKKELDKARSLSVQEYTESSEDIINDLEISNIRFEESKGGNICLAMRCKNLSEDGARIDGSISFEITENETSIGVIVVILPLNGIANEEDVSGKMLKQYSSANTYKAEIEKTNLWKTYEKRSFQRIS